MRHPPGPCSLLPVPGSLLFRFEPDGFGGGTAQDGVSCRELDQDGLIVVLAEDFEGFAGADAGRVEECEELGVAFLEAGDGVALALGRLRELELALALALGGTDGEHGVAVRAGAALAELFPELGLEGRRDRVLQALRLLVNLVPLHAEDLAQHALDEVMAQGGVIGGFAALPGEAHDAVGAHLDEAVALEALEGHGHGRRRDLKPVRKRGGNHLEALGVGLENGLQVVFLRNVDGVFHGCAENQSIAEGGA